MKKIILTGLLIFGLLPAVGLCDAGNPANANEATLQPGEQYIWQMENPKEFRYFSSEGTGTVFQLNKEVVFEGQSSCKVIPGGSEETKLGLKITKILKEWNGKSSLFLNLYIPEDTPLDYCFLGMATLTPEWSWVDGCMAATPVEPGQWNKVIFNLPDKMRYIKLKKQYVIYLCFWNDENGVKVPLQKTTPFYIDGIGLIQ